MVRRGLRWRARGVPGCGDAGHGGGPQSGGLEKSARLDAGRVESCRGHRVGLSNIRSLADLVVGGIGEWVVCFWAGAGAWLWWEDQDAVFWVWVWG